MGQKGKEMVEVDERKLSVILTLPMLTNGWHTFNTFCMLKSSMAQMLRLWKKELEEQSMDEMNHAKILANRIIQLGGTPTTKLRDFNM
jgi:bacterioferritin (cytochrome b1)